MFPRIVKYLREIIDRNQAWRELSPIDTPIIQVR